jgi:DNA-binding CsgD family transcriptional regulator
MSAAAPLDVKPALPGRESELRRLRAWLDAPAGGLLLVGGEAGVGKTHLWRAAAAESSVPFLAARCWPGAEARPYQALLELVRLFGSATLSRRALASLSWLPGGHKYEDGTRAGEAPSRAELNEGLLSILEQAGHSPTVLVLDDLHWADDSTLEFLPLLIERLRGAPVWVLATFRATALGRSHPLRACRDAIRRCGRLAELDLPPLAPEGSAALLEGVFGGPASPALLAQLHRQSGGLPLWLTEMAGSLLRGGLLREGGSGWELAGDAEALPIPESFRDAVLIRLEALDPAAAELLQLAALLGVELDLDDLTAAGGPDSDAALEPLLREGLLKEISRSGRAEFPHALTREVILESLSWPRRRKLHAHLAEILAARGADPEALAEHLAQAGRAEEAARAFLEIAKRNCHIHAYGEAFAHGWRALELWPAATRSGAEHLDSLERLANCAKLSGKLPEAVRLLCEALEHPALTTVPDHARAGRLRSEVATLYQLQGANQLAMESRALAAESLERAGEAVAAAREHLGCAGQYTDHIRLSQAMISVRRAVELAAVHGEAELHSRALAQLGMIQAMQGSVDEGKATVREGLALALRHNLSHAAAEAYRRLALSHDYASDYAGQKEIFRQALDYCALNEVDGESALCVSCMAYACFRTGEWKQAFDICRQVLDQPGLHEIHYAVAKGVTALLQTFRGEFKSARQNIQESHAVLRLTGQVPTLFNCHMSLGILAEEEGDEPAARAEYLAMAALWRETEDRHDILMCLGAAARYFGDNGDAEILASLADLAGRINSSVANQEALAILATLLGELALLQREPLLAVSHYRKVTASFDQLKLPLDLALAEHRLGLALIAAGDRAEAALALRRSHRLARNLGARPLAGRVVAALAGIGESVMEAGAESPERAVWAGLTQRQREVAVLIGQGCTNKEIAAKLYLSPRTIDMHVGHILGRLDCRTRAEATRKLAALGVLSAAV